MECVAARAQYAGGRNGEGGGVCGRGGHPTLFDAYCFTSINQPADPGTAPGSPHHGILESVVCFIFSSAFGGVI